MKKILSIIIALLLLASVAVLSVSAADTAKTVIEVNTGDEVVYSLNVTVPEKVVGCDFSIYFDSTVLKVTDVADFTGSFDEEEHQALINPNLKDEVIGNWSILSGIRFDDNNSICTVKFEAQKSADTHITYYVRYLYPESLQQFEEYKFTCKVDVNKKTVIDNKAPELNVKEEQPNGLFVNSVTGDSADADVNTAQSGPVTVEDKEKDDKKTDTKDDKKTTDKKNDKSSDKQETTDATVVSESVATSDETTGISTPSQLSDTNLLTSVWFWVVVSIIVVGAAVCVILILVKKKGASVDTK